MTTPNLDWLSSFTTAFDPASASAEATVTSLVSMGTSLFFATAALYLSFLTIKIMLSDGPMEQISEVITAIITVGIIFFPLQNYPTFLGWVNMGFSQVATQIAGVAGGTSATTTDLVWAGFQKIVSQAFLIFNSMPGLPDIALSDIFDLENSSKLMTTWLFDLFVSMLAMLCMTGSAVLFMVIYTYALLMFMVGAVVGPIMLPWYLLSPFKFVAEGWIKFMITAGMYRVVAISIIAILTPFLNQMQTVMAEQAAYFTTNATTADKALLQTHHLFFSVSVLVFSIGVLYMLAKVPEIVSGLMGGAGGGGFIKFGGGPKMGGGQKPDTPKPTPPAP